MPGCKHSLCLPAATAVATAQTAESLPEPSGHCQLLEVTLATLSSTGHCLEAVELCPSSLSSYAYAHPLGRAGPLAPCSFNPSTDCSLKESGLMILPGPFQLCDLCYGTNLHAPLPLYIWSVQGCSSWDSRDQGWQLSLQLTGLTSCLSCGNPMSLT